MKPTKPYESKFAEVPSNETVRCVQRTLDTWAEWAEGTDRGVLTPYQFLALILWAIKTPEASAQDEALIIDGWARVLLNQMRNGIPALHPVTLLPIEGHHSPSEWVLSIQHAQEFLDSLPIGFGVERALQHFREQAALGKKGGVLTLDDAIAQRKGGKNKPWTDSQVSVISQAVQDDGLKAIAKRIGISHQTLSTALNRDRKGRGPKAMAHRYG